MSADPRQRFEELLLLEIDGAHTPETRAEFEALLASSPDLRQEARQELALVALLRTAPRAKAPPDLLAAALAEARTGARIVEVPTRRRIRAVALLASGAAAAVLAVVAINNSRDTTEGLATLKDVSAPRAEAQELFAAVASGPAPQRELASVPAEESLTADTPATRRRADSDVAMHMLAEAAPAPAAQAPLDALARDGSRYFDERNHGATSAAGRELERKEDARALAAAPESPAGRTLPGNTGSSSTATDNFASASTTPTGESGSAPAATTLYFQEADSTTGTLMMALKLADMEVAARRAPAAASARIDAVETFDDLVERLKSRGGRLLFFAPDREVAEARDRAPARAARQRTLEDSAPPPTPQPGFSGFVVFETDSATSATALLDYTRTLRGRGLRNVDAAAGEVVETPTGARLLLPYRMAHGDTR